MAAMAGVESRNTDYDFYLGRRLSYGNALCTVRYIGPLEGTTGQWLGVEWDDSSRGKHNGQFRQTQIFRCLSPAATAASFVRLSRAQDSRRAFLEAIRFKYGGDSHLQLAESAADKYPRDTSISRAPIEISGKRVQEIGFDRIQKQQSDLRNLKIVVVDQLCIAGLGDHSYSPDGLVEAQQKVAECCPEVTELDLGWNLIETWQDISEICQPLKKLRRLGASGLRLRSLSIAEYQTTHSPFLHLQELYIDECLFTVSQISELLRNASPLLPSLRTLSLSTNGLSSFPLPSGDVPVHGNLKALLLENNRYVNFDHLPAIFQSFPNLQDLSLQGNQVSHISSIVSRGKQTNFSCAGLDSLNLASNQIPDYALVDALPAIFPNLTSLRISKNPLYDQASHGQEYDKARSESAFSLTLARVPFLTTLNYTAITTRDREEGEIYYLSVAEKDIEPSLRAAATSPPDLDTAIKDAKAKYPRYDTLCTKYDRESILTRYLSAPTSTQPDITTSKTPTHAPNTLGARIIHTTFYISPTSPSRPHSHHADSEITLSRPLPRTLSVYTLKSILSRTFPQHLQPLQFRLIYESPELDPVKDDINSTSWDDWGDWDVDDTSPSPSDSNIPANDASGKGSEDPEGEKWVDGIMYKAGQKWKRREIEILDGFREWGFWIDEGVREVRIRVEPFAWIGKKMM